MKIIVMTLFFLSLIGGLSHSIWEKSFLIIELVRLVSYQKEQRRSFWHSIDLATYASIGLRRRMQKQGASLIGSKIIPIPKEVTTPIFEKDATSILLKKYRFLPRAETARIDLCSTLLEENAFFIDRLEKLLSSLYRRDSHFISLKKKRPNLEKDLLKEISKALKQSLAWDTPERLPQIESLQPDTSWLLSLQLASADLHNFFHRMLRMKTAPGQEPQSLLYYVCIFRWHPSAIKMPRIHVSSVSPILFNVFFGETLGRLIKEKFATALSTADFESIEEDHYTGLQKLLKPLVMENIFLESCSELGIDQSQFDNVLDFSRYIPPRQEWLLDLVTDSGTHLGWRIMKRPFF